MGAVVSVMSVASVAVYQHRGVLDPWWTLTVLQVAVYVAPLGVVGRELYRRVVP
jgi:hypothetical protein